MKLSPEQLIQILEKFERPVGLKELIRLGGIHPGQQPLIKRTLRELVKTGRVAQEGKRFSLHHMETPRASLGGSRRKDLVEGILHVHRDGFGFVHPLDGSGENIYLPVSEAARALDNDRVVVERVSSRGRSEGRMVQVKARARQMVVGTYIHRGKRAHVVPNDDSLPGPIVVPQTQLAQNGDMVKVRLGVGGDLLGAEQGLFGEVAGSLGQPGHPSQEVLGVVFSKGFSDEFPPEVMDQADRVSLRVTEDEARAEGRRDLRSLPLVTIDGEDARDFDDAIYAEPRSDGFRLVVAIADVSHYVRPGFPLDAEAVHRGTSVYLPDRVLPMLPERLSNGICSLKPDEDRLCMVADLQIDRKGKLTKYEIYPGVMRSAARCTYNEVQAVLDGEDVPHRNAFKPRFQAAWELASVLHEMRMGRGAIDFDIPESRVVLDENGVPLRMERRERKHSHRLVEECMLAANEAVAKFFQDQELPSVYRFHGEPDEDKLALFSALARAHGFALPLKGKITSKELNHLLEELEGHPERRALNQLLLRSMMQAVYSAEQIGHYGLAAEHYLHFTSPIRRYPDLLVHRLLKAHWARHERRPSERELEVETETLESLAAQSSERERAAIQIEREVVSFYATLLMKDRIGEEFEATVSAIVDFGFFVELDEVMVEGLVKGERLGRGFRFDQALHAMVYPNGRRVRVGQRLKVRLVSANVARRQIDLEPVVFEGEEEPVEEAPRSPHPGFDRMRAAAAKKGTPPQLPRGQKKKDSRRGGSTSTSTSSSSSRNKPEKKTSSKRHRRK